MGSIGESSVTSNEEDDPRSGASAVNTMKTHLNYNNRRLERLRVTDGNDSTLIEVSLWNIYLMQSLWK